MPIDVLKLFFENFKSSHEEFTVLQDLTTEILASMGIILRSLRKQNLGRSGGVESANFREDFDDEDEREQTMDDEGVFSSTNVLTI